MTELSLVDKMKRLAASGIIYENGKWYMLGGDKRWEVRVEFIEDHIKRTPIDTRGLKREPIII